MSIKQAEQFFHREYPQSIFKYILKSISCAIYYFTQIFIIHKWDGKDHVLEFL